MDSLTLAMAACQVYDELVAAAAAEVLLPAVQRVVVRKAGNTARCLSAGFCLLVITG